MSNSPETTLNQPRREVLALLFLLLLALSLRLLIWRWHEQYPLSGDEREYLDQALALLQERRYTELRLMRPPLYTGFLAASIYLFDSLIQNLRLIQTIISTLTVLPAYGLTRTLFGPQPAFAAGLLIALNYTLAATATELLTETLFLAGLTLLLWLLAATAQRPHATWLPILAGLSLGALALLRSVALPLLPLGFLWLLLHPTSADARRIGRIRVRLYAASLFLIAAVCVIGPWTIRNYVTYGGLIVIDTTGAENLWLDNDPAGREAVKRELYALGEDRLKRQQIATQRGIAAITSDPAHFLTKSWGEAIKFFALQQFDDLRQRPAIWVPPAEVWLRLLLGDAAWLLLLLGGALGLWLAPCRHKDLRWVLVPWALYTLLTASIFHVELRYRLPLYPALLPYAAWLVTQALHRPLTWSARHLVSPSRIAGSLTLLILLVMTMLNRPYLQESALLTAKHVSLWQAEQALHTGNAAAATQAASMALSLDDRSVLARVALARADLLNGNTETALQQLRAAEQAINAHPHAHLLHGAILLSQGQHQAARAELAYESASLEDLQGWAWQVFPAIIAPPARLELGKGLDLGHVRNFHLAEPDGYRWTQDSAELRLAAPAQPATLRISVAPGRPAATAPVELTIRSGTTVMRFLLKPGWQTISVPLAPDAGAVRIIQLSAPMFQPRQYDRASPDGRSLGVMVAWAEITIP